MRPFSPTAYCTPCVDVVRAYLNIWPKFASNFWSINKIETRYHQLYALHTQTQTHTQFTAHHIRFSYKIPLSIKLLHDYQYDALHWQSVRPFVPSSVRQSWRTCYTHIKIWLSVIPYNPIYFRNFNLNNNKHNVCMRRIYDPLVFTKYPFWSAFVVTNIHQQYNIQNEINTQYEYMLVCACNSKLNCYNTSIILCRRCY